MGINFINFRNNHILNKMDKYYNKYNVMLRAFIFTFRRGYKLVNKAMKHGGLYLFSTYLTKPPYKIKFRDGTFKTASNREQLYLFLYKYSNPSNQSGEYNLKELGKEVHLITTDNADGAEVFKEEIYKGFPVLGAIVIDVGANIGDSPIYFSLMGAKLVLAYEPSLEFFEIAKQNISKK